MTPPDANVLMVLMDTARADHFEPYGAAAGSTPVIAGLARAGVSTTAYAPANWTIPSHAALFTGQLPRSLGLGQVGGGFHGAVANRLQPHADSTLAAVLRRHGVATRAVSANLWVSEQAGFGAGFDEFVNIVIPRQPRTSQSLRDRMGWYLDALLARIDDGARATEEILARWIAEARTKPFFWFVNLCECHSPYLPPRPYNDLSMIRRLLAGRDARRYMTLAAIMLVNLGALEVPERSLDRMRHLYRQSIGLMDAWLGRILERLDDAGLLDNTEVIVTSDHGENLGEQGRLGHAIYLDERLIKVPFVAAGPLDLTTKGAMSLTDVPALLGSAFGLDHPWQPHAADGVVVAQYDSFGRRDDPRVQERLGRFDLSEQSVDLLTQDVTVAVDGTWKLISSEAGELAFNLVNDPGELSPVPIDNIPTPTLQALRAAVGRGQDRPAADQPAPPTEVPVADVADLEERMRMLGYL